MHNNDDSQILQFLSTNNIRYETNVDLKKKTWIHRGGKCKLYIIPQNTEQLICIARYLYSHQYDFLVLGHTSNTYILNTSDISIIISTKKCNQYTFNNNQLICECGVCVVKLAREMLQLGYQGFEYLTDLPGTVGAAIYNNSSCHDNSITKLLIDIDFLLPSGDLISLTPDKLNFQYRLSALKTQDIKGIIINARLKLNIGNKTKLQQVATINELHRKQLLTQKSKILGSTINNCFSLGRMPMRYNIPYRLFSGLLKLFRVRQTERTRYCKHFICLIAGVPQIASYISDSDIIIFIWKDDAADRIFPIYLDFMYRVYKTKQCEINII